MRKLTTIKNSLYQHNHIIKQATTTKIRCIKGADRKD